MIAPSGMWETQTWLLGFLLGAASATPSPKGPRGVSGNGTSYIIVKPDVGVTSKYRIHLIQLEKTHQYALLKVAKAKEHNYLLATEFKILRLLQLAADDIERQSDASFNYHHFVPEAIDHFEADSSSHRMATIVKYAEVVEEPNEFAPLSLLVSLEQRVDIKTAVWIMGKLLKTIDLAAHTGVSTNALTPSNILIQPDKHWLVVFDWTTAKITRDEPAMIRSLAQSIVRLVGGTTKVDGRDTTVLLPSQEMVAVTNRQHREFERFLSQLFQPESSALEFHNMLYRLADTTWPKHQEKEIWVRDFHPFVIYPAVAE